MLEAPWIGCDTSWTALAISELPVACPRLSTTPLGLPVTLLMPITKLPVPLSKAETDVHRNSRDQTIPKTSYKVTLLHDDRHIIAFGLLVSCIHQNSLYNAIGLVMMVRHNVKH